MAEQSRQRGRPPQPTSPLSDVLRDELHQRGWRENERRSDRVTAAWVHTDGERARSLTDAIVRQLVRELT